MANNFTVLDNAPNARRQQLRWNGLNCATVGGGTKYLDGCVAVPTSASAVRQAAFAGFVARFVVNVTANSDTAGDTTFQLYIDDGAGPQLIGSCGPFVEGATGVIASTDAAGSWNDGALLWLECESDLDVDSDNITAFAAVEYWTTL